MSSQNPQFESTNRDDLRFLDANRATGYAGNTIVRQSETRDETSLSKALDHGEVRFCLFANDRPLVRVSDVEANALFGRTEAEAFGLIDDGLVLLGHADGAPRLAGPIELTAPSPAEKPDPSAPLALPDAVPDDVKAIDMRSLAMQGLLSEAVLGLLAQARSLLGWHANHPFCARCGNETAMEQGGVRRRCGTCNSLHFPRVDPVVIMLAIDGENCLLGRSHHFDAGRYSALAGFVEPGETIEDAVRRETHEEAGIEIGEVVYFTSQPWPFVSTLMIGCHARALSRDIVLDTDEMDDCQWFSRAEARRILAGIHSQGITAPPEMAIAYRLIAAFAEAG